MDHRAVPSRIAPSDVRLYLYDIAIVMGLADLGSMEATIHVKTFWALS